MNKKERFQAVCERRAPDCMPVWTRVKTQMVYGYGLKMTDVTGQDWIDSEKVTKAVLASIKGIGYDVAIPTYIDHGFGVPSLGGTIKIPEKFGMGISVPNEGKPVQTKADWPKIKKMMARFDVRRTDPRMKSTLEVIRNVSREVGGDMPLSPSVSVGTQTAMELFRPYEAFLLDMIEDPKWVDEMSTIATDWTIDWIRAQYEAGSNSATFITFIGTVMTSPEMNERFNLELAARVVETVKQEFTQGTWLHIHGDMKTSKGYQYLIKLAREVGIEGFHFDENHPADWVKENVVEKLGKPACIIIDGATIANGPVEKIREEVKKAISKIGDGLGIMMAPSCLVLPATPNDYFKAWVDATHEYGKYALK